MMIISFKEKTSSCPYCQEMNTEEDYAFGADFPSVANNDSFYIRKSIRANCFELVFEGEGVDNSCRISFCPICGRKLK